MSTSAMTKFAVLMRREWLQHRFGWSMAVIVPLGLALLLAAFGQIEIGDETVARAGDKLPTLLALASIAGSSAVLFAIASVTSLIIVSNLARRDHGDRSVEFWLSLPVGHGSAISAPLVVHLLVVPALALLIGLVGGTVLALLLVVRVVGIGEWLALPWGGIAPAALTIVARLLAGLPLALLWLSPLVLGLMLLTAHFRSWGWVIFAVGIGLGSELLDRLFGQPLPAQWLGGLLAHAATSLVNGGAGEIKMNAGEGIEALRGLPAWALKDLGFALRELAQPLLAGALAVAAGCFYGLLRWRERGASAGA